MDEPAALGGDDLAASPIEYALGALISCQVVVCRPYVEQLNIRADDVQIVAECHLNACGLLGIDKSVRPGFTSVALYMQISGPEIAKRYDELRRAVDVHCPVLDLFVKPIPVATAVNLTSKASRYPFAGVCSIKNPGGLSPPCREPTRAHSVLRLLKEAPRTPWLAFFFDGDAPAVEVRGVDIQEVRAAGFVKRGLFIHRTIDHDFREAAVLH